MLVYKHPTFNKASNKGITFNHKKSVKVSGQSKNVSDL